MKCSRFLVKLKIGGGEPLSDLKSLEKYVLYIQLMEFVTKLTMTDIWRHIF